MGNFPFEVFKTPHGVKNIEGPAPEEPHLAVYTDGPGGLATAIPPGAMMLRVLDSKVAHVADRMILVKVGRDTLDFKCACNNECKAWFRYTRVEHGKHSK